MSMQMKRKESLDRCIESDLVDSGFTNKQNRSRSLFSCRSRRRSQPNRDDIHYQIPRILRQRQQPPALYYILSECEPEEENIDYSTMSVPFDEIDEIEDKKKDKGPSNNLQKRIRGSFRRISRLKKCFKDSQPSKLLGSDHPKTSFGKENNTTFEEGCSDLSILPTADTHENSSHEDDLTPVNIEDEDVSSVSDCSFTSDITESQHDFLGAQLILKTSFSTDSEDEESRKPHLGIAFPHPVVSAEEHSEWRLGIQTGHPSWSKREQRTLGRRKLSFDSFPFEGWDEDSEEDVNNEWFNGNNEQSLNERENGAGQSIGYDPFGSWNYYNDELDQWVDESGQSVHIISISTDSEIKEGPKSFQKHALVPEEFNNEIVSTHSLHHHSQRPEQFNDEILSTNSLFHCSHHQDNVDPKKKFGGNRAGPSSSSSRISSFPDRLKRAVIDPVRAFAKEVSSCGLVVDDFGFFDNEGGGQDTDDWTAAPFDEIATDRKHQRSYYNPRYRIRTFAQKRFTSTSLTKSPPAATEDMNEGQREVV